MDSDSIGITQQIGATSHPSTRSPTVMQVRGKRVAPDNSEIMVALMGATGTGKSTFINFLTNDDRIKIGHRPESQTSDIQTAEYREQGRRIILVDVPGFDDSRDDVTDTDILEKIVRFLEPESGRARKLNGIIYMHRISDPRVGGIARKNIRMFEALCGKQGLRNVRFVTTNWSRVTEQEGNDREAALKQGAFQPLLEAGADMCRHANTVESAKHIVSKFTAFHPVTLQIQEELRMGKPLADTSAGMVLTAEMREMQMKHEKELADLKGELEEAAKTHDEALRAELERERRTIQGKMARVDDDRQRLGRPIQHPHEKLVTERNHTAELHEEVEREAVKLRASRDETARQVEELLMQIDAVKQREEPEASGTAYQMAQRGVPLQSPPDHAQRRGSRYLYESGQALQEPEEHPQDEYYETKRQALERSDHDSLRRIRKVGEKQQELEERLRRATVDVKKGQNAGRGGSILGDMKSIVHGFANKGGEYGGAVGTIVGGVVGATMAPVALLETRDR
ncbi:P-loop containing nucleoside triphosphate hydrolase protein [Chiua virens]|nr:P-loop containing nucleoside triphosphate hydrolase protein [Chiua virens]